MRDVQPVQAVQSRVRERDLAPTLDLADRMTAFRRKNAAATRRPERPSPSATPTAGPSAVTSSSETALPSTLPRRKTPAPRRAPSPNEFDRNLVRGHAPGRLFNPQLDPKPSRPGVLARPSPGEPGGLSDSSVGPTRKIPANQPRAKAPPSQLRQGQTAPRPPPSSPVKQLFDPSRDDPFRFSALSRQQATVPAPLSTSTVGNDYVSASSTSDTRSLASSAFTLSSVTSASSVDSGPRFSPNRSEEPASVNPFVAELKRVYREISIMEKRLLSEDHPIDATDDEPIRVQGLSEPANEKWVRLIEAHKDLAEANHNLLTLATNPNVPASVQSIPDRYNIPTRLWSVAFHRMIDALRRASITSTHALEHLTEFIYYAYRFYSGLLEERNLQPFRGKWLEALGDLARSRMAVAIHVANHAASDPATSRGEPTPVTVLPIEAPASRIDNSPLPSVGILAAAAELGDEDERDTWRTTARDWYAEVLKDTPGTGRLQYYLGTLSRDLKGEELRAMYHFVKSLVANHSFDRGREAVLDLFSPSTQQALSSPTASAPSLFLHIHGLLFTRIDLDQVKPTLARFIERLELDTASPEESDWTMMAILSIGSLLEFGKANGQLRKVGGLGALPTEKNLSLGIEHDATTAINSQNQKRWADHEDEDRVMGVPEDEDHDISHLSRPMQALTTESADSPSQKQAQLVFSLALDVTFSTLSYLLKNPSMPARTSYIKPPLNPYITVILTFVSTLFKNAAVVHLMERSVPWAGLASLLSAALQRAGGPRSNSAKDAGKFAAGQLLPEDWCVRGMEWAGRRVYERGFWKVQGPACQGEMDVITHPSIGVAGGQADLIDGIVEEEGGDEMDWEAGVSPAQPLASLRWKRLRSTAEMLIKAVPGFEWDGSTIIVAGELARKVAMWEEEAQREAEESRARKHRRSGSEMEVDEDEEDDYDGDDVAGDESDDPEDSVEVKELKARRQYLLTLLRSSNRPSRTATRAPRAKPVAPVRRPLQFLPGYTVLVVDTNILLSSLSVMAPIIDSKRWTVVVPLAVITELDGLSKNSSPLGNAANDALGYLISAVPAHSVSLKVQTSKGNYLYNLSVRSESIDFRDGTSQDRNMDDLILRSALWQAEHFVDYQYSLSGVDKLARDTAPTPNTSKVVLLSFDRNLRLKARSRKLDAADEKDMATIIAASG